MKKFLIPFLVPIIGIILIPLILSIFNILEIEIPNIIYLLLILLLSFITGNLVSHMYKDKLYLKGILTGIFFVIFLILLSFIFHNSFTLYRLIYYLLIIVSSTLGAITTNIKKIH